MASVKIGQLVIRTLAKPIANQLKSQAANHETFRKACIGLAQFMHRSEITLRSNLIGGTHQKVRPLNDAKAVANGANAISEGFLFAVAAALIIGETYRGSRNRAKQRDSTEAAVEEVRVMVQNLAERLDINLEEIKPPPPIEDDEDSESTSEFTSESQSEPESSRIDAKVRTRTTRKMSDEEELERLRASTQILLQMALRSGWIQGEEALRLDDILQGRDTKKESSTQTTSSTTSAPTETNSSLNQVLPSSIQSSSSNPTTSNPTITTTTPTSDSTASQPRVRSEVLAAIAQERVRAMVSEMNQERTSGRGIGLEGEGASEGWQSSADSRSRPRGESGDEGDALGAASRLAEMLERAGAGVDTKE